MSRALLDESHLTAAKLPVLLLTQLITHEFVARITSDPMEALPIRPLLSRRPFFARDTLTRPFKSRRTFNALNKSSVRVLIAGSPLSATPASPRQRKPHDWVRRSLLRPIKSDPVRHKWTPRSLGEVLAVLHSRLNPERNSIWSVIRPRFTSRVSAP